MAKQQEKKQQTTTPANTTAPKTAPVRGAAPKDSIFSEGKGDFIFGRTHFIYFGVGLALVLLGLLAMIGGQQAPDQWNEAEIYSPIRITLAPMMILAGFGAVIAGIFKKA
jgi:hypothetical protein